MHASDCVDKEDSSNIVHVSELVTDETAPTPGLTSVVPSVVLAYFAL